MDPTHLIAYVGAVLILTLSPGPSTMLGSAHGMRFGAKGTLPTIAGDLSANALQMLAAAVGLAAIITRSATAFTLIKWAGVAYLAWMGLSHLLQRIRNYSSTRLRWIAPRHPKTEEPFHPSPYS